MSFSLVRFLPAAALIFAGVAVMAVATAGVFRIHYVLNRLHAAAMGDTLGLLLVAAGLAILFGWSMASVKLFAIVLLFWLASPVCSHLLASLEASTNEDLDKRCAITTLEELENAGPDGAGEGRKS